MSSTVTDAPVGTQPDTLIAAELIAAKEAARALATLTTAHKNTALEAMAAAIEGAVPAIMAANADDLERGRATGLSDGLLDRLRLDERRILALATAVRDVIAHSKGCTNPAWFAKLPSRSTHAQAGNTRVAAAVNSPGNKSCTTSKSSFVAASNSDFSTQGFG